MTNSFNRLPLEVLTNILNYVRSSNNIQIHLCILACEYSIQNRLTMHPRRSNRALDPRIQAFSTHDCYPGHIRVIVGTRLQRFGGQVQRSTSRRTVNSSSVLCVCERHTGSSVSGTDGVSYRCASAYLLRVPATEYS